MQVNEIGLPGTQLYAFKVDETFHAIGYTMNRLQTPILNQSSPFELVFGIKLDYQMLKTFGVKCFLFLRPYNINNFDFKTQPSTFISYIHVHKGYKCLTTSKKTIISRHVIFYESCFSYAKYHTNHQHMHLHHTKWQCLFL